MGSPASPPTPAVAGRSQSAPAKGGRRQPLFASSKERMSAVTSKVRIYDLAKDLKIDTKRLIEEVRREGVDVSVPSNSISKELAEKIRDKYFPKKDAAVKRTVRIVKKAARPVIEEAPLEPGEEFPAPIEAAEAETPAAEEPAIIIQTPSSRVVRKLSPALRDRGRERAPRGRVEYAGPRGETATPQTTYIPPPDAGRRRSRRGSSRSGKRPGEGKGGRFDRDFIPPPQALTLEQRIAGRMDSTSGEGELKPVRLVEGSTVKEFAEKLGIKPKDVVALRLQPVGFATINQALAGEMAAELAQRFGYDV